MGSHARLRNTLAADEACRCPALALIGSARRDDCQVELRSKGDDGRELKLKLRLQLQLGKERLASKNKGIRTRSSSSSRRRRRRREFITEEEEEEDLSPEKGRRTSGRSGRGKTRARRRISSSSSSGASILAMARRASEMQILFLMLLLLPLSLTLLYQAKAAIAATNSDPETRIRVGQYNSWNDSNDLRHNSERRALSLVAVADKQPTATTTTSTPPQTTTSQPAPEFAEPIGNQTVAVGRDAQLSCRINNLGNFKTAWLRVEDKGILTIHNNVITRNYRVGLVNDDEGKNFVLTIKSVLPSDKGGYMCQINSVPPKYTIGHLDVLTPPAFVEDQTSAGGRSSEPAADNSSPISQHSATQVTVAEGSNATLTCKASGHPEPLITWRREDNEPILVSPGNELTKLDGSSLALNSVNRLHSGAYLCIASNGVQPAASKRQVLNVQFSPVIRLPQTELGVQLGQPEARLTCIVELNPLGSYHWVKLANNNNNNNNNARIEPQQQQLDDQSLIDQFELFNSDKFEIVIKQASDLSSSTNSGAGESQQQQENKVEMSLTLRQLERKDLAWYKCIARNSLGIQSNSIRVYESSSFSLNNMFRGGISQQGTSNNNNNNNNPSQDQLNDQADSPTGRRDKPARAHTRSSWLQRPTSGRQSDGSQQQQADHYQSSQSSSSAASLSPLSLQASLPSLLLLFCSHLYLLSLCLASLMKAQFVVVVAYG